MHITYILLLGERLFQLVFGKSHVMVYSCLLPGQYDIMPYNMVTPMTPSGHMVVDKTVFNYL